MSNWCNPAAQAYLDAQRIPFGDLNRMPVAEREPPLVVSTRCDHKTSRCIVCAPFFAGKLLATAMTEMIAEDLGLPLRQWDPEWLTDMYGLCPWRIWDRFLNTDAPYAFWLGADA